MITQAKPQCCILLLDGGIPEVINDIGKSETPPSHAGAVIEKESWRKSLGRVIMGGKLRDILQASRSHLERAVSL